MKTSSHTSLSKGFTLIELLVVIAIIAVLAATGFAVGPTMMDKARRTSAQASAVSLANAVEQFYSEYSALPGSGSISPAATDTGSAVKVLNILAVQGADANLENPRKIKFFSHKEAKGSSASARDGVVYSSDNTISKFVDPWGQPYYLMMDNESDTKGYDELLEFTPKDSPAVILRGRRVAVYSLGVDKSQKSSPKNLAKSW